MNRSELPYRLEIVDRLEDMLPSYPLVAAMPSHGYDERTFVEMLQEMIPHGYSMGLAYDGGTCIAVAGYWINTKLFTGRYAELDNVAVADAYRNKGIGEALCMMVEADAIKKGCRYMVLDCFIENKRAQEFYNRLGYTARGYHMIKKVI